MIFCYFSNIIYPDKWREFYFAIQKTYLLNRKITFYSVNIKAFSNVTLDFSTFFVGGCWGQLMLLFWKLVDETKMGKPPEHTEQNYQSFYPSEQFTLDHFTMRHPVQPECTAYFIFRYILTIYLQAMNNLISKLEKVDARKMFDVPKIKRSCLKSWSNWIGWLLSWLFSFCEGRDCREDGKSRNTAARLEGGLHGC